MTSVSKQVKWLCKEFGLTSVYFTGADAWLIILARTCRMFAFGTISLIIALFLSALDFSDTLIGLFMTLTLAGDVVLSLVLALVADHIGRRRVLLLGGLLMILSGSVFAYFENYWILVGAAVIGVISATGGDFGPFRSIEESTLSHLTTKATRSDVLSWYITTSSLGSAAGLETGGKLVKLFKSKGDGLSLNAYHKMFWVYVATGCLCLALSTLLSRRCEIKDESSTTGAVSESGEFAERLLGDDNQPSGPLHSSSMHQPQNRSTWPSWLRQKWTERKFGRVSPKSRPMVLKLWALLTIDSLADGMVSLVLTNYYLARKFDLSESYLGDIMSISYVLMSISTIFAGPLARHLGLVNTMVFTHLPSSLAVLLFPVSQNVWITMGLLYLRTGLNNMDQAPRAAFIAAIVKPEERTAVMGITGMLRTLASTIGPSFTGFLADSDRFWIAYVVAGALRIGYDLGLYFIFSGLSIDDHDVEEVSRESSFELSDNYEHRTAEERVGTSNNIRAT